jgi:hypothetical protein
MDFERFKAALVDCAAARNVDADTFISIVSNCQPLVHATVAESVKWHDDRSTYTGVVLVVHCGMMTATRLRPCHTWHACPAHLNTFNETIAHTQCPAQKSSAQSVSVSAGVHAKGGPSTIDKKVNLQDMVDRQAQDYASRRMSVTPSWTH